MKDQNIFIINQLAAGLPGNATALDLGKVLLQYSLNPNAELSKPQCRIKQAGTGSH